MGGGAVAHVIQNVPLGKLHRIEGGSRHRSLLRDFRQRIADVLVEGPVLETLPGIAEAPGQHRQAEAGHAHRHGTAQRREPLPIHPEICQIHNGQIQQQRSGAEGVLVENAVLVLIIGHEIHQHIGNQEQVPLIPPGPQGQPQQGQQGKQQKFQLLRLYAFIHRLHGAHKHRLEQGIQGCRILEEEILIPVGHHALPIPGKVAGDQEEPKQRPGKQPQARPEVPPLLSQQSPDHQPQGHHGHIYRCILLHRQGQRRRQGSQGEISPVNPIQQPQQQRGEEAIFVKVVAGAPGIGGIQQQHGADQQPGRRGQTMLLSDFPGRNHRRGQHCPLQNLQGSRIGSQSIEGQHQIIYGRHMHRKVGQQAVPLQGGQGQAGFSQVMEHLAENAEIVAGGVEAVNPPHRPQTDKQEKAQGEPGGNPGIAPLSPAPIHFRLWAAVPAPDGEAQQQQHQQQAGHQQRPAEGGRQGADKQHRCPKHHAPPLPSSGGKQGGQQAQPGKNPQGQRHRHSKGHLPQPIQPGQIPQLPGQEQKGQSGGQNPRSQPPAQKHRKAPKAPAANSLSVTYHFAEFPLPGISPNFFLKL